MNALFHGYFDPLESSITAKTEFDLNTACDEAKKQTNVFPLTLSMLIFSSYPIVFIGIFRQALLKSDSSPV